MRGGLLVLALLAVAACNGDFSGSVCEDCPPDGALPAPDAAPPDAAGDLCAGVTCDEPPADGCEDGLVTVYPATGSCDGATGRCVYTPSQTACDQPPPDECTDNTLVDYPEAGTCAPAGGHPRCNYAATDVDCGLSDRQCQSGACVDPCQPNPCDAPPAARCTGPNLHTFASPGACTSPGGVVACAYAETVTNCAADGRVCSESAGACVNP